MPGSAQSLALTDSYREQLLTLRQQAARGTAASWQLITLAELDRTFRAWQLSTAALITAGKHRAVRLANAYLTAYISSELDQPVAPVGVDPGRYLQGLDGRAMAAVLLPALFTVKIALANRADERAALALGLNRALATTSREVVGAARVAQRDAMAASDEVQGWRRAVSANACGACLGAADGEIHAAGELLEVHTHCRCVAEPVVAGVPDRVLRPTGTEIFDSLAPAEQDALFQGRGGRAKAALIRSGRVRLAELVARSAIATGPDQITEASMASLNKR